MYLKKANMEMKSCFHGMRFGLSPWFFSANSAVSACLRAEPEGAQEFSVVKVLLFIVTGGLWKCKSLFRDAIP
jgi:hypothetical protein